jgi:hypothetical protein
MDIGANTGSELLMSASDCCAAGVIVTVGGKTVGTTMTGAAAVVDAGAGAFCGAPTTA